ncbi:hypothetical protein Pan153_52830 [Gimesia panareensis]|uniref:Uncharacterized protein n=1 Tax=Gimesia panareensis TaxID=2527978 RepID=A0A518FW71_9PLAN|nr:hypothetical protein Pan153_52830 [Gimesia panareensis]
MTSEIPITVSIEGSGKSMSGDMDVDAATKIIPETAENTAFESRDMRSNLEESQQCITIILFSPICGN